MSVIIRVEDTEYIIKKKNSGIFLNGKKLVTSCKNIIDENEKSICKELRGKYIKSGMQAEYADVKAALNNAQYCEIELALPIEFMDYIVLYLLGFEKINILKKDIYIIIKNDSIYLKNKQDSGYYMPTNGSSCISYDHLALLDALIVENNG